MNEYNRYFILNISVIFENIKKCFKRLYIEFDSSQIKKLNTKNLSILFN